MVGHPEKIKKSVRKFNSYVFFSTVARSLLEVFVGSVLFSRGFQLHEVVLFYLLSNFISIFFVFPITKLTYYLGGRVVSCIGVFLLIATQILLSNIVLEPWFLVLVAATYGLYRRCYWFPRRYYNCAIMPKKNVAKNYSFICVFNRLGAIIASYLGALILDYASLNIMLLLTATLFIASGFFLKDIKEPKENTKPTLKTVWQTFLKFPKNKMALFCSYELTNVFRELAALYIFVYVKSTFTTVGILDLVSNIAILLFTLLYGRLINKNRNFLILSAALVTLTFIMKVNVGFQILLLVAFFEGFVLTMSEVSIGKELYTLSQKFDHLSYVTLYELPMVIFRSLVLGFCYFFVSDLKIMIYIVVGTFFVGVILSSFFAKRQKSHR